MEKNTLKQYVEIDISSQTLEFIEAGTRTFSAAISSALKGVGELADSEKTPRGWHIIRAKIGGASPLGTVFVGRRATGELYDKDLAEAYPDRDWILSRILWLSGLEPGRNRLGNLDTMRRYIYIHGCPDHIPMKLPSSHGCIRMKNAEVITLFDLVSVGCPVLIRE